MTVSGQRLTLRPGPGIPGPTSRWTRGPVFEGGTLSTPVPDTGGKGREYVRMIYALAIVALALAALTHKGDR